MCLPPPPITHTQHTQIHQQEGGRLLAETDALLSLAQVAADKGWVRPTLLVPSYPSPQQPPPSPSSSSPPRQQQPPHPPSSSSPLTGPVLRCLNLRHPVVEAALSSAAAYIPNTVALSAPAPAPAAATSTVDDDTGGGGRGKGGGGGEGDGGLLTIVTGPNMGGKSTYIRCALRE